MLLSSIIAGTEINHLLLLLYIQYLVTVLGLMILFNYRVVSYYIHSPPNNGCTPLRHALSGSQGGLVGLLLRSVRTPFGQSGSLRGLKLVPSKWRYLVPGERRDGTQSRPPALIRVLRNTPQKPCGA